jgi:predicted nucleic acid-binding protein
MPYPLDSDVLIDVSRGKQSAREYLDELPEGWAISRFSALELIVGARDNRDVTAIDAFLSAFVVVPLRESTGTRAYDLLKRYAIANRMRYRILFMLHQLQPRGQVFRPPTSRHTPGPRHPLLAG